MKIIGKSRFDQNIYDKINKGADAIELHLDDEFILNPSAWNQQYVDEVPIAAVHAPFLRGNDLYLEEVTSHQILMWVCEFADKIAHAQNHNVIVVMHLGLSVWRLQRLGIYHSLCEFLRELVDAHSMIEIAIENVTRFNTMIPEIIMFDNVDFHAAPQLAHEINHPRIGTCLDICHAMIDMALIQTVNTHLCGNDFYQNKEISGNMYEFFAANKDTIKLIHLANINEHGMRYDHGMPFLHTDSTKLQTIINLYNQHGFKCPITIEVKESDYANGINFQTTLTTLNEIL